MGGDAAIMTTPTCPNCRSAIDSLDVNVAGDVAYCRRCNLAHQLSELILGVALSAVNPQDAPAGAWFRTDDEGTHVGATHRTMGGALGTLFISLFWNGIVSVFVLVALAATLSNIGIELPEWAPPIDLDDSMNVGMTVFLWLFLTPFIAIGAAMFVAFLSCVFGRTELHVRHGQAELYRGIGPIGLRRRFETGQIKDVRIEDRHWRDSDGDARRKTVIVFELRDGNSIKFGTQLSEARRRFVAAAARKLLVK
jgi:hypothetical protein